MAVYTSTTAFGQPPKTATSLPPTGTTTPAIDPLLLQPAVTNVLTLQAQQEQLDAAAQGSQLTATGAQVEASAYATAAEIAGASGATEAIAERVRQVQLDREVQQTVGGIKASVAANGFTMGGSGLDIMKSSLRQGYLATQISGLRSEQTQIGYMEQAAAATGEMAAANVRADAALQLAASQTAASQQAAAQQAALTGALTQVLSGDPNASQLVSDLTSGNTTAISGDLLLYGQANGSIPGGPGLPAPYATGAPGLSGATGMPGTPAYNGPGGPAPAAGMSGTYSGGIPDAGSINAGTRMIAPGVWAPVVDPGNGAAFSGYMHI